MVNKRDARVRRDFSVQGRPAIAVIAGRDIAEIGSLTSGPGSGTFAGGAPFPERQVVNCVTVTTARGVKSQY